MDRADVLSASSAHRFCEVSDGNYSYTDEEGGAIYGDASFEKDNLSSERDLSRSSVRQDNDPWGLNVYFTRAQQ